MLFRGIPIRILWLITTISGADVYSGVNTFAFNLFDVISTDENLVFSPFSAHFALSLAYLGSAGETSVTFQRALHLPDVITSVQQYKNVIDTLNAVRDIKLHVANKIYVKNGYRLRENFRSVARNYFASDVDNIDFLRKREAADNINGWVRNKTRNKIDKLFDANDFDQLTVAVVLNAIYFKGAWLKPFTKLYTTTRKFEVSPGKQVDCEMMLNEGYYDYLESPALNSKILRMKYYDERFAMTIVLPNAPDGLERLERQLAEIDVVSLPLKEDMVSVWLPKFKIETKLDMESSLTKIGLGDIFTDGADFSNLIENQRNLRIRKVIHKAFIEVNEEGSEASAATGLEIVDKILVIHPIFRADHPFVFYITGRLGNGNANVSKAASNTILFMGKVVSPRYD